MANMRIIDILVLLLIFLYLSGLVFGSSPVPDILFDYDPNMCPSPAFDSIISDPNISCVYTFQVRSIGGREVTCSIDYPGQFVISRLTKVKDGRYWVQTFQFLWTPPDYEIVHYIEIKATDDKGRSDRRTLVFWAYADSPQIWPDIPVVHVRGAQRLWQVAKKRGIVVTLPTHVLN